MGASLPGNWLHRNCSSFHHVISYGFPGLLYNRHPAALNPGLYNRHPAALNPGPFPLDDQNFHNCWETLIITMAAATAHGFGAIMAQKGHNLWIVVTIQCSESTG